MIHRVPRPLAAALAWLFTGLALVGVVVPGLPTFPFLLLAAWAAARGSRRLHDWLYAHPRFGPDLRRWRDRRAISRRAKVWALALLALSFAIMWWRVRTWWVLGPVAVLFTTVGTWLATRREA